MISPRICELVDSMKDFARRLATAEEEIVQVGPFGDNRQGTVILDLIIWYDFSLVYILL